MYKCLRCNQKLEQRKVEEKIKIGFFHKILIFFGLKKNPNTSKIDYYCKSCNIKYDSSEIQNYSIEELPYYQKKFLMTKPENEFYKVLIESVPMGTTLIPQVSLSSIITTNNRSYRNKIDRKTVDFVLFKDNYFNPLLVIELDDSTHERTDRMIRDHFVDLALLKSNLPIIHFKLKGKFNKNNVKAIIDEKIKIWNYS